jgi:flagellin
LVIDSAATSASLKLSDAVTASTASIAAAATAGGGAASTINVNNTSISIAANSTMGGVVNAINQQTGTTGVTASLVANTGTQSGTYSVQLSRSDVGSNTSIQYSESSNTLNQGGTASATGTDASGHVGSGATEVLFNQGQGNTLISSQGDQIQLAAGTQAGTINDAFEITSGTGNALFFQIGSNSGDTASVSIGNMSTNALGLGSIDVTSGTGAAAAITAIDKAISTVSTQSASLGAFQNQLQSNVSSLTTANENISASASSITDVNMASEMSQFTKYQILAQASTSMLTQANSVQQNLLSLIKGG